MDRRAVGLLSSSRAFHARLKLRHAACQGLLLIKLSMALLLGQCISCRYGVWSMIHAVVVSPRSPGLFLLWQV